VARNVEIKARVADPGRLESLVREIADEGPAILRQRDTFFRVPRGRLKLREIDGAGAELVFYERANETGPRPSEYRIVPVSEPASLLAALTAALGPAGVVEKTRTLYRVGRTRIHLDDVTGLGPHLELEVVQEEGETVEAGERTARELLARLEIPDDALVAEAYVDRLTRDS
jgi:adenylate cyclase class IV